MYLVLSYEFFSESDIFSLKMKSRLFHNVIVPFLFLTSFFCSFSAFDNQKIKKIDSGKMFKENSTASFSCTKSNYTHTRHSSKSSKYSCITNVLHSFCRKSKGSRKKFSFLVARPLRP